MCGMTINCTLTATYLHVIIIIKIIVKIELFVNNASHVINVSFSIIFFSKPNEFEPKVAWENGKV